MPIGDSFVMTFSCEDTRPAFWTKQPCLFTYSQLMFLSQFTTYSLVPLDVSLDPMIEGLNLSRHFFVETYTMWKKNMTLDIMVPTIFKTIPTTMEDMFDTKKQFETWPETMSKSKTGDKQVKGDKTLKVLFPPSQYFLFFQNPTNHHGQFCLYILSSNTSRVY